MLFKLLGGGDKRSVPVLPRSPRPPSGPTAAATRHPGLAPRPDSPSPSSPARPVLGPTARCRRALHRTGTHDLAERHVTTTPTGGYDDDHDDARRRQPGNELEQDGRRDTRWCCWTFSRDGVDTGQVEVDGTVYDVAVGETFGRTSSTTAVGRGELRHVPLRRRIVHALRVAEQVGTGATPAMRPRGERSPVARGRSVRAAPAIFITRWIPRPADRRTPFPMMGRMLRILTAGESHGPGLAVILEGLPAGVPVSKARSPGSWRGDGTATGAAAGSDSRPTRSRSWRASGTAAPSGRRSRSRSRTWSSSTKYRELMGVEGEMDPSKRLTRPRPGHADLVGTLKYGFDDVRNVLERASARETAARVAVGAFCKAFLARAGRARVLPRRADREGAAAARPRCPRPMISRAIDASPVRCCGPRRPERDGGRDRPAAEGEGQRRAGSSRSWPTACRRASAPTCIGIASSTPDWPLALMSIQSVKGVEVGDGFATAARPGSRAHDEIVLRARPARPRHGARWRDRRGHVAPGQPIRVRAAMKPFSTVPQAAADRGPRHRRARAVRSNSAPTSARCPPGGVVGEAVVALHARRCDPGEVRRATRCRETARNLAAYLEELP